MYRRLTWHLQDYRRNEERFPEEQATSDQSKVSSLGEDLREGPNRIAYIEFIEVPSSRRLRFDCGS